MNYECFKESILKNLIQYLPEKYENWTLEVRDIPKVNGYLEGVNIIPQSGSGGSPTIYLNELYDYYQKCGSIEKVCQKAASVFVMGMDCIANMEPETSLNLPKDKIIFCLVHAAENERLLKEVPHRIMLDLAVIYRVLLRADDGGFNSTIINNEIAEELGVTEDELFALAEKNTPMILREEIHCCEGAFAILTNEFHLLGAACLLYPGLLKKLATELDGDLYVLPSSIHEVFLVPVIGQDVERMNRTVVEANNTIVKMDEILSHHVYYYDRAKDELCIPLK